VAERPGQRLTLAGSGSDSEGDPLTYEWTQVGGPGASLEAASTASVRVLLPDVVGVKELRVQLRVSDGNSTSAPALTTITVRGPLPPVEVVPPEPKKPEGAAVLRRGGVVRWPAGCGQASFALP
jgi:hypothetical protein